MKKPFKYVHRPIGRPEYHPDGINRVGSTETLVGTVQGKPASDLEERMARALDKLKVGYEFRARITSQALGQRRLTLAHANLPGEVEIDHLVEADQTIPILVQGEISHFMTPYQKLVDTDKQASINEFGQALGWHEVIAIPFTELKTQDEADSVARRIVAGVYVPTGVI
jgi:hypothetical protein